MEKPSKLLVPLAAAAAITSADNALADGGASEWGPALMRGELSNSAKFCEELRNAKGPNIKDYVVYFNPDRNGIQMTIARAVNIVMENGDEARLSCMYGASKSGGGIEAPEGIPVKTFSERLFLPNGPARNFTAVTPTATYEDYTMDGFPDNVDPKNWFTYVEAIKGQDIQGAPCVEGQVPDVCEELGVGLDDFDAAIRAGRKALQQIPPVEEQIDDC